jgi:hypothetical protein
MTADYQRWQDDDSDAMDRRIKAERKAHEKEVARRKREAVISKGANTFNYTRGVARGPASPAELERRARADRYMNANRKEL